MQRRNFLSATIASAQTSAARPPVRIGVDVYSLQSQNWTPFQSLDFCSKLGVKVVHFSEIRFLGNLEPDNLTKVRDYAKNLNFDLEIGMKSICPTSTMFDATQGTAEEQLGRMIKAAAIIGSPIGAQAPAAGQGRGPVSPEVQAQRLATQREDLEVSIQYTKKLLGL